MMKKLSNGESVSGRPLSGTSCANIRSTLRYFLQCAVDEKLIPFNPVAVTKPPKEDTEERKALTDEQWHFLRSRLSRNDRRELAILILLETGMREEEVCALKWSDLTDDGFFHIHAAVQKNGKIKETKNPQSIRYVKLSPHLRRQLSRAPHHGDYILGYPHKDKHKNREYGDPLRPGALAKWWRETFRDSVGLSDYSLHEIGRHTTVSQMIAAGVDIKSACALTGQSEITMLRIYAHADKKKASGNALDALQSIRDNRS
jgi:site-specific recombinase XerD